MPETVNKKKNPWRKRMLIGGLAIVILMAGVYAYYATQKYADTKNVKPDYTVDATRFIQEFQENNKAANEKYTNKIVALNGTVSEIEATADTTMNIKFVDTTSGSYAIFAFQQQHLDEARGLKVGDIVSIKGSCSGGVYSDILEATSISFKRSTLNK